MKKGIIFDLDGTLWDSLKTVVPAWNAALVRRGQKPISESEMAGFMGKTGEQIYLAMMPDLPKEQAAAIFAECCLEEQGLLNERGGRLYPGLEEALSKLKKRYSLSIVSNCHPEYLDAFFSAHGLKKYFDDFECHGSTGLGKAENISLIISRNSIDRALYVGDTEMDFQASKSAGIPFVLASYGFGSAQGALYKIASLSELEAVAGEVLGE